MHLLKKYPIHSVAIVLLLFSAIWIVFDSAPLTPEEAPIEDEQQETVTENEEKEEATEQAQVQRSQTAPTPAVEETPPAAVRVLTANIKLDESRYGKAVNDYAAWRMQIHDCEATPYKFVAKSGQQILLDSTSDSPQQLMFGAHTIQLTGKDARIIEVTTPETVTYEVNCRSNAGLRYSIAEVRVEP